MATSYRVLGQTDTGTLGATTEGTLYTALAPAIISTLAICNQAATAATYRIAVRPAAASSTLAKHWIVYGATVAGSDSTFLTPGLTLAVGDKIQVYGSTNTLSFSVFGSELA
jgi:hypothetical protein